MQVLAVLLVLIPLSASQFPPRFRNQNFRNIQTPLASSASKQRPYVSIPIVLLPDGQVVPKPRQVNYHFVGNAPAPKFQSQDKERGTRSKGLSSGRQTGNYQVVVQPTGSHSQPKKKSSQAAPQGNSNAFKQQYGSVQQAQQNRPQVPIQTSTYNQQRYQTTSSQQKAPTGQQNAAHKQAVANLIHFATSVGASVTGYQATRPQQNFQQTVQVPSSDVAYHQSSKTQEGYLPQQAQATNPKQTDPTFFNQLQNSQNIHLPYVQQTIQAQPNLYHNQQLQQTQTVSTQSSKQPSLPSSTRHTSNSHTNIQQLTNVPQQNVASSFYVQQNQGNVAQPNSYTSAIQHTVQQTYNTPAPQNAGQQGYTSISQQANSADPAHSTGNTKSQSQLLKTSAVSETEISRYPNIHSVVQQQVYPAANQASPSHFLLNSQGQQANYASTAQTAPLTYTSEQNPQATSAAGQTGSQTGYVSLQSAQEIPANYIPSANNGQISYVPVSQTSQQTGKSQQNNDQSYTLVQNVYANQNVPSVYAPQSQSTASSSSSLQPGVQVYTNPYTSEQMSYTPSGQQTQANYVSVAQSGKTYEPSQYSYVIQNAQDGKTAYTSESQETQSESSLGTGQLIYASSTAKETNSPQTLYGASQGEALSYVSFPSTYKTDGRSYGLGQSGVVTPGTTYAKVTQTSSADDSDEHEDDEDGDDEEASYKVVYIPLDILKNILSNSIENQSQT